MNFLPFIASSLMLSNGVSYNYSVTNVNTAIITSVVISDDVEELYIPDEINGYTVSGINSYAFAGCISVKKIVIPDTVLMINDGAFMSCTVLEEVYIGNSITSIPDDCFFACPSLKTVHLPDMVEFIGNEAFFGCSELDLYIPEKVSYIGNDALGKHIDPHLNVTVSIHGFLLRGVSGSYAETYALENNIDFIDMDNYLAGDINNDNFVNASDASAVLDEYSRVSTGMPATFTKKQHIVGDMDSNGILNAIDASSILEIYTILSTN